MFRLWNQTSGPRASSGHIAVGNLRAHTGAVRSKLSITIAGIVAVFIIAAIVLVHHYWPFREASVRSDLSEATSSDVQFEHFRNRYFPPGCVAENVTFRETSSGPPLITVRRLAIKATLRGLLQHHIGLIDAEGVYGELAPQALFKHTSSSVSAIDAFVVRDALLKIPQGGGKHSLEFRIHNLSLRNLNDRGGTIPFDAVLDIPLPPGLATVSGKFGPWRNTDPGSSPIAGNYSLQKADLSVFHSIAGTVSSTGTFSGNLQQLQVQGSTHSPELIVAKTQHGLPLDTTFQALVDTHTGDVTLSHFTAQFGRDQISGSGSIARRRDGKRSTVLDLNCTRGRIEDTFYPFIKSDRSPLTGDTSFRMKIALASGHESFLQKLHLNSDFQIQQARFTNSQTQTRIGKISAPPDQSQTNSAAELQGNVNLEGGVARFSSLDLHDDQAAATFQGNYALKKETIDLHGKLKTAASLTKATHGVKAIFAKVIEAFYKKKPHVTVVPVHIGGTYSHPSFGLDL